MLYGFLSKDISTLDDLFVHTLRDIYYAERQIVTSLRSMIEKAADPELKAGFQHHLQQTRTHVQRIEQVFQCTDSEAKEVDCPAIEGILNEASEVAGDIDDKTVLDAGLIAAAQAVEHYEIRVTGRSSPGRSDLAGTTVARFSSKRSMRKRRRTRS